jgi:hypothetical protein
MSKATVYVKIKLELEVEQDTSVDNIVNELDYNFVPLDERAKVLDTEMVDFTIA